MENVDKDEIGIWRETRNTRTAAAAGTDVEHVGAVRAF